MKRFAVMVVTVLGLATSASPVCASWSSAHYSGYQPWWNIFAKRYKCLTPEEERLQKFWHDYYDALRNFYGALDHVDWVAYYKNHGYQINGGCGGPCGGGRVNYAPVFVSPTLQWAVPSQAGGGAPVGPSYGPGGPGCAMPPSMFSVPGGPGGGMPVGAFPGSMPPGAMMAGPGR